MRVLVRPWKGAPSSHAEVAPEAGMHSCGLGRSSSGLNMTDWCGGWSVSRSNHPVQVAYFRYASFGNVRSWAGLL